MSVKDIIGPNGYILASYIESSGDVQSVSAAPNGAITVAGTAENPTVAVAFAAAGDLMVGTGANTGVRLPIGGPHTFLKVNAAGDGLEYDPAAAPGGVQAIYAGNNINVGGGPAPQTNTISLLNPLTAELNLGAVGLRAGAGGLGTNGQILSSTGAATQWVNPPGVAALTAGASGLITVGGTATNPTVANAFTAGGDLLVGTGANTGAVLPKGANGTYLQVNQSGNVAWGAGNAGTVTSVAAGSGLNVTNTSTVNPQVNLAFQAAGDLMVGTGTNAGTPLTKGANGTFLQVNQSGNVAWGAGNAGTVTSVAAGSGLNVTNTATVNPQVNLAFAAAGDLMVGTGPSAGAPLTKGLEGQYLKVIGGALAWGAGNDGTVTNVSGAANSLVNVANGSTTPSISLGFTAAQQLLVSSGAGTATTLSVGAEGKYLKVSGGAVAWGDGNAGTVTSVSGAANSLVNVVNGSTTPSISLGFSAAQQLLVGTGVGTGTVLNVGAEGKYLKVSGGAVAWGDGTAGTVTSVAAGSGLSVTGTANVAPVVNLAFQAAGDLMVGTGANAGARLGVGTAGQVLTVSGGVPTWAAPSSGGPTINRNNSTAAPLPIAKPTTANDTMILTTDRTSTPFNQQIYNVAPGGTFTQIPPEFQIFNWSPPQNIEITSITGTFSVGWTGALQDAESAITLCAVNDPTTILSASDLTLVGVNGSYNYGNFNQLPLNVNVGTTYSFYFGIEAQQGAPPGDGLAALNSGQMGGEINVTGITYPAGAQATFTYAFGKFRTSQNVPGFTSAALNVYTSQSYVSSQDTNDWIQVGAANTQITYT